MIEAGRASAAVVLATCALFGWACNPAAADVHIEGQVQAGGAPLANSTVTLWAANAGEPRQLAQTKPAMTDIFNFSAKKLLARMSAYIWLPRAARRKVQATIWPLLYWRCWATRHQLRLSSTR